MGIFNRIKQIRAKAAQEKAEEKAKEAKKPAAEETYTPVKTKAGSFGQVLLFPRVSEKAAIAASGGTYVFNVTIDATKIEIKKAVEVLYKVNVVSVRIVRNIGKFVRRGRIKGQRNRMKKAYVTLKRGQKIELYEGV